MVKLVGAASAEPDGAVLCRWSSRGLGAVVSAHSWCAGVVRVCIEGEIGCVVANTACVLFVASAFATGWAVACAVVLLVRGHETENGGLALGVFALEMLADLLATVVAGTARTIAVGTRVTGVRDSVASLEGHLWDRGSFVTLAPVLAVIVLVAHYTGFGAGKDDSVRTASIGHLSDSGSTLLLVLGEGVPASGAVVGNGKGRTEEWGPRRGRAVDELEEAADTTAAEGTMDGFLGAVVLEHHLGGAVSVAAVLGFSSVEAFRFGKTHGNFLWEENTTVLGAGKSALVGGQIKTWVNREGGVNVVEVVGRTTASVTVSTVGVTIEAVILGRKINDTAADVVLFNIKGRLHLEGKGVGASRAATLTIAVADG